MHKYNLNDVDSVEVGTKDELLDIIKANINPDEPDAELEDVLTRLEQLDINPDELLAIVKLPMGNYVLSTEIED